MITRDALDPLTAGLSQNSALPWDLPPRFDTELRSPLDADGWRWRVVLPGHRAISQQTDFLRQGDYALQLISEKYGEPEGYCVLGGRIVAASTWEGISIADQYAAVTRGAGAFPCGSMYYF